MRSSPLIVDIKMLAKGGGGTMTGPSGLPETAPAEIAAIAGLGVGQANIRREGKAVEDDHKDDQLDLQDEAYDPQYADDHTPTIHFAMVTPFFLPPRHVALL
ncbi:MAG: hypothetical protein ACJA0K_000666 [Maricaulis maris]|jgi:hypothetical protein